MDKQLILRMETPDGMTTQQSCTSLRLPVMDNRSGQNGGLYGIRPGHISAILALQEGKITAYTNDMLTLTATVSGGFAVVEKDIVTILTDRYVMDK